MSSAGLGDSLLSSYYLGNLKFLQLSTKWILKKRHWK